MGNLDFATKKTLDDPALLISKDVPAHDSSDVTVVGKPLSSLRSHSCNSQVCVTEAEGTKNLEDETTRQETAAGATTQVDVNSKIVQFLWWMKKQGYKESTILSRDSRLKRLLKLGANLSDPESIKEIIASEPNWSESRKQAMVITFDLYAKWSGITWEKPNYKPPRKLPFIPLEHEIDDLTAGCNKYVATFLQLAKETGARAGEIYSLQWTNVGLENRTVRITAEKGSNPRILKISMKLIGMLSTFPKETQNIFSHYNSLKSLRRCFDRYRKRTAHKYGNSRILNITLHTLRHWKATTEYHKTKDILHVMQLLGHRNIQNTLVYTQLMETQDNEEFVCKIAKTPNEIQELIENGFEYIYDLDNQRFFRKRK
jgi:integrase